MHDPEGQRVVPQVQIVLQVSEVTTPQMLYSRVRTLAAYVPDHTALRQGEDNSRHIVRQKSEVTTMASIRLASPESHTDGVGRLNRGRI